MPSPSFVSDLQIDQNLEYQKWEWRVQRVGWVCMALTVLAALAGLLGSGPLSKTSAASPDAALRVEYNRFIRFHNPETLTVHVAPGAAQDDELRVWIDAEYVSGVELEQITPEPLHVEAGTDRYTYVFRMAEERQGTQLLFHFEADRRLNLPGRIGLEGKEPAHFQHFVYP